MANISKQKYVNWRVALSLLLSVFSSPFIVPFMYYKVINSFVHGRSINQMDFSSDINELSYEKVTFKSKKDSVTLKGIFFSAKESSNKTLIVVHGLSQNKLLSGHTKELAEYLTPQGYNVLAFDLRCHGESDGNLITFGCYEKYDVMGAIDYLKQQGNEGEKIALLGFSMGAVIAIEAAGKDKRVDAVIADSPFRDLKLFILNDLSNSLSCDMSFLPDNIANQSYWSVLRRFPFKDKAIWLLSKIYQINMDDVCPMNTVKNIPQKPIFLIHSKNDRLIPYTNSELIFKSLESNSNAMLWLTEKPKHIESLDMYPDEYLKRVKAFLDSNI